MDKPVVVELKKMREKVRRLVAKAYDEAANHNDDMDDHLAIVHEFHSLHLELTERIKKNDNK